MPDSQDLTISHNVVVSSIAGGHRNFKENAVSFAKESSLASHQSQLEDRSESDHQMSEAERKLEKVLSEEQEHSGIAPEAEGEQLQCVLVAQSNVESLTIIPDNLPQLAHDQSSSSSPSEKEMLSGSTTQLASPLNEEDEASQ